MIFPEYSSPRKDADPASAYLSGLSGRRIAVVATGALGAMYLPAWLHWLRRGANCAHEDDRHEERVGVRRVDALTAFSNVPPEIDDWGRSPRSPKHLDIDDDVHAYVVHPATMSFVSRMSAGLCDSPTMLAIQGTKSPVVGRSVRTPGVHGRSGLAPVRVRVERATEHPPPCPRRRRERQGPDAHGFASPALPRGLGASRRTVQRGTTRTLMSP